MVTRAGNSLAAVIFVTGELGLSGVVRVTGFRVTSVFHRGAPHG